MTASTKRLDNLKKKQAQLSAQIQALEAAEKARERKRDTRRKILIGAYYLDQARDQDQFNQLVQRMDGYLKRNTDRALFDLEPLDEKEAETSTASA